MSKLDSRIKSKKAKILVKYFAEAFIYDECFFIYPLITASKPLLMEVFLIPLLTGSKTPISSCGKSKKLG